MRQSGRTTRIANFVVEQLYTSGQCIATDHVMYEYSGRINSERALHHLIEKVRDQIRIGSGGRLGCSHRIIRIERGGIPMIHFELTHTGSTDIEFFQIRAQRDQSI
jgi:hypothetical protein